MLYKKCSKCNRYKSIVQFSKDLHHLDGLCSKCKTCRKKTYEADKETVAADARKWYLKNTARHNARSITHYQENKEHRSEMMSKWYERNKEQVFKNVTAYRAARPGWNASRMARRRARVKLATPVWADQELIDLLYAIAARVTVETGVEYHVDHMVPINSKIVCGLHCDNNLQLLVGSDNSSKSNKYWPDMP